MSDIDYYMNEQRGIKKVLKTTKKTAAQKNEGFSLMKTGTSLF